MLNFFNQKKKKDASIVFSGLWYNFLKFVILIHRLLNRMKKQVGAEAEDIVAFYEL